MRYISGDVCLLFVWRVFKGWCFVSLSFVVVVLCPNVSLSSHPIHLRVNVTIKWQVSSYSFQKILVDNLFLWKTTIPLYPIYIFGRYELHFSSKAAFWDPIELQREIWILVYFCGCRSLRENMIASLLLCVISKFCKLRHIYRLHRVSRCSF